jgi:hypothetical protein
MMIDLEESANNILQKVYLLRSAFRKELGYLPNTVFLGCVEYYTLLRSQMRHVYRNSEGQFEVFGMNLERSIRDNYLSVGWVMIGEQDKQV